MPRKMKLYLPLDVEFFDNQRILDAGEKAGWLYLAMCCEAKRRMSDGFLTRRQISGLQVTGWQARLRQLIGCGLVAEVVEGQTWQIVGFLDRNYSADRIEADKAADRARKTPDSVRIPGGTSADSRGTLREVEEKHLEVEDKRSEARVEDAGYAAFTAVRESWPAKRRTA